MLVFFESYCEGAATEQLLGAAKERNSCGHEQSLPHDEGRTGGNGVGWGRGAETTKETLPLLQPKVFDFKQIRIALKMCFCEGEMRRQDILFLFVYLYPFLPLDVCVASLALKWFTSASG